MKVLAEKFVRSKPRGFTLIEMIIASVIGLFIAVVILGSLKAISASAEKVEQNIDVASDVRFAAKMIAADLGNLYRDRNPAYGKFVGMVGASELGGLSSMTFYAVSHVKARAEQPENDVYEVEYRLLNNENKKILTRRIWPNPDKVNADSATHGVLTTIADDINTFDIRYFDGKQWATEWPEDFNSIPELAEVTIAVRLPNRRDMAVESLLVNFVRCKGKNTGAFEEEEQQSESEQAASESEQGGTSNENR